MHMFHIIQMLDTKSRLIVSPNVVFVSTEKSFQLFQTGLMQYNESI